MLNVMIRASFSPAAVLVLFLLHLPLEAQVVADAGAVNPAIEGSFSVGGGAALLTGSQAAFQERFQHVKDGFGGVEELHYKRETKQSSFSLEGHAVVSDGNYRLAGRWSKNETVYIDFGYDRFRVFSDGNGIAFQPTGTFLQTRDPRLTLDRTKAWLELGYTPENRAQFKIRYERSTRSGEKSSTEFGDTNLTGSFGTRSIVPSFLEISESRDVLTADARREAENYQWQAGLRYEHSKIDDGRENDRRPFEAASRVVTSKDQSQSDLFSGHAFVERRISDQLVTSAGALITTLDTNIGGSRIYGADYDAVFDPLFARRQSGDLGFLDLAGGAQLKEYVFNLNAVYLPAKNWTIQPAVRYEHLHMDNVSTFTATSVGNTLSTTLQNLQSQSQKQENQLNESLEIRYTGRPSWTYSLRGEWFQTRGDLTELQADQATSLANLRRDTEYQRTSQKYTLAAHWYARPGLTFAGEYYYKLRLNDFDANRDSTLARSFERYPAFFTNQDFSTHDVNFRVSWRPLSMLSFVTRYDYQYSNVVTSFRGVPETDNGRMTTHIISQSFTWNPLASLYITSSANLTYNQLATPASAFVSNSDNNYLNVSLGAGYAVGKVTDLYLDGNHYLARDYTNNAARTLPYGADQRTDNISLTWVRRQTERLIYTVKYTYAMNRDGLAAGNNDYRANLVYAKVQYKF